MIALGMCIVLVMLASPTYFWWCCCGPTIETCSEADWPSTITLTTDGYTISLVFNSTFANWQADQTVTVAQAKDVLCADVTTITVHIELDCLAGVAILTQTFRLVTGATCASGAPPCYYGSAYPSSNTATVALNITSFTNSPFAITGTWPTVIPNTGSSSYGNPAFMCPAPPLQGSATAS